MKCLAFILIFMVPVLHARDYSGYKVIQMMPRNEDQQKEIQDITTRYNLEVWVANDEKTIALISPENYKKVDPELASKNIERVVLTEDVQKLIDQERRDNYPDIILPFQFDKYHEFENIMLFLSFVHWKHWTVTEVVQIGTTYEGRPIRGLKIGCPRKDGQDKPIILIDALYHAREWITPATALYIVNQLVSRYQNDSQIREFVETFDWYIFPVMNPDGYKYTWKTDRLWRKNRRPDPNRPECKGSDLNRNFPVNFGGFGTSNDSCSEYYPGPFAFSEKESNATRNFILKHKGNVKSYVNLHSFSQLWMSPYAYTMDLPQDYAVIKEALDQICPAVIGKHGTNYTCGPVSRVIYVAAGSALDWSYIFGKVVLPFSVEERDTGTHGFILPNEQIIPTAEEVWAGIVVLASFLLSRLGQ